MLKSLEGIAKALLARLAGLLLWRPGRARGVAERLGSARRILLLRMDARVGEALLTTPLVQALARADPAREVDLAVHPRCVSLLEGCPGVRRVVPLPRRLLWLGPFSPAVRAIRAGGYDGVVDCTNWTAPSVTSAIIARLGAPRAVVIGPAGGPMHALRDVAVPPRPDTVSEVAQRLHLLSPLLGAPVPDAPLAFRSVKDGGVAGLLGGALDAAAFGVVNPGGRLGWRRVPTSVFAAAARTLLEASVPVLVTWGPGEDALAREVVEQAPGARLAPPTDLDTLAAMLARARVAVCNNTGPMHLAVALGTPTLGLFLKMDPARWGHSGPPHRMLDLTPFVSSTEAEQAVQTAVTNLLNR